MIESNKRVVVHERSCRVEPRATDELVGSGCSNEVSEIELTEVLDELLMSRQHVVDATVRGVIQGVSGRGGCCHLREV